MNMAFCFLASESVEDGIRRILGEELNRRAFAPVRRELFVRRKALSDESGNLHQRLKKLRGRMKQVAARIAKWKLADEEFDAIEDGLVSTYRSARKTMALAYDDPVTANFHEWRKQAKYHSFHLAL